MWKWLVLRVVLGAAAPALCGIAGVGAVRADAATVNVTVGPSDRIAPTEHSPPPPVASLSYIAAPGETNDVTVTGVPNGYRFHDDGASVTGDVRYCSAADPHTVTCTVSPTAVSGVAAAGFEKATLLLGDGNDVLHPIDTSSYSGLATSFTVDGGLGNDTLSAGGAAQATLIGGPGDDRLRGGPGSDVIAPGAGNNVVDGGPGQNTLDLSSAHSALTVDLRAGTVRGVGETDQVANVQSVLGGAGNDTLIAGTGDISLDGGAGRNVLFGGPGHDRLMGSHEGNQIVCGSVLNQVLAVTRRDVLLGPCRDIRPGGGLDATLGSLLPLRSPGAPVAKFTDIQECLEPPCTTALEVRIAGGSPRHRDAHPGRIVGQRRTVRRRYGSTLRNFEVRLSAAGARLLAHDRRLRVEVSVLTHDGFGSQSGAYSTILSR